MADTVTTTLGLTKPEVGASEDSWGEKINTNFDLVDDALDGTTAVSLDINGGTIDGAVIGGATPAAGSFTTGSFTGNVTFGDNDKAIFGAGSDLEIYHDGSDSYLVDSGTGDLLIRGGANIELQNGTGTRTYARFTNSGDARLYYDNALKLATTATGVDITGTLTSDGLTVDGDVDISSATPSVTIKRTNTANEMGFTFLNANDVESFKYFINGNNNDLTFQSREANVLKLEQGGDISFYEDTGTTPKFFWDASAESLGIGTSSLTGTLSVVDSTSTDTLYLESSDTARITLKDTSAYAQGTGPYIQFQGKDNAGTNRNFGQIWGISDTANNGELDFKVRSGGSMISAMRIDSSGNVGIGTSSPLYELHVEDATGNAVVNIESSTSGYSAVNLGDTNNDDVGQIKYDNSTNSMQFTTNASEAMRIDSSGNVRMGDNGSNPTDTDADNLIVANASGAAGIQITSSSSSVGKFVFGDTNNARSGMIYYSHISDFMRFDTGANERMRIDSSGNLLVGRTSNNISVSGHSLLASGVSTHTADGAYALQLNRLTSDGDIVEFRKDGTTVGSIGVVSGTSEYLTVGSADTGLLFHDGVDRIYPWNMSTNAPRDNAIDLGTSSTRFKDLYLSGGLRGDNLTFSNLAGAERMRIDGSGNVGIGTSSPAANLEITDSIELPSVSLSSTGTDHMGLITGTVSSMMAATTGNNILFAHQPFANRGTFSNFTERMRIDSSGATSIGTTTSSGQLTVKATADRAAGSFIVNANGDSAISIKNSSSTTVGTIVANASSTSYNTTSDYRLKTDAQPMTGASARVQALKPVNFEWIANGTRVDGFLAHEAQEIVPEAVTGTKDAMRDEEYEVTPAVLDDDGNVVTEAVMGTRSVPDYQGIDQSKLVPLLTAALQEALTKIDALETRITALEG